jgi:L-fucose mutarotase
MLKGIPPILSPELVKVLMEMGHGDEIVIADGNFPAASVAQRLIRLDGHGTAEVLEAVLRFFPLDNFVPRPVALMAVVEGDPVGEPAIWRTYKDIVQTCEPHAADFEFLERYAFYERARQAYAVVATSEMTQYANVLLKKGLVKPDQTP